MWGTDSRECKSRVRARTGSQRQVSGAEGRLSDAGADAFIAYKFFYINATFNPAKLCTSEYLRISVCDYLMI